MFITMKDSKGIFNLGKDAIEVACHDWNDHWNDCGDSRNTCSMAFSQPLYQ